ncbi:hypothetical protein C7N43_07370 [Sphingobacteriales bacterium UPWRP_1]|nr:hypothetical protein B6N25_05215 [Sphingobacteriales bacterium TSM_CSS]PSJ77693.1 hypothetical protein C7N43_07370 [Sphingobacteriales bacterium UPWRP_1]
MVGVNLQKSEQKVVHLPEFTSIQPKFTLKQSNKIGVRANFSSIFPGNKTEMGKNSMFLKKE